MAKTPKVISLATRKAFKPPKSVPEFRDQQSVETLKEAMQLADAGRLQAAFIIGWDPVSQSFTSFMVNPNNAEMGVPGARFSVALHEASRLYLDVGEIDAVDMAMIGCSPPEVMEPVPELES